MGKLKSYSTVSRHHLATTRLATQMTNVSALMRCQRRYVFTSKFTLFKNKPQNIRAGGLQIISTPQLPLAMWPGLCLSATEMVLQIIPSTRKSLTKIPKKSGCSKIFKFRSDLGVGHFPDGYYRPCEKLHIEQR